MINALKAVCLAACLFSGMASGALPGGAAQCNGSYPNPITDICWSCVLPITVGPGIPIYTNGQEDTPNVASYFCYCPPFRYGTPISFWEPTNMVEVVRMPYCFPLLNGTTMKFGNSAPAGSVSLDTENNTQTKNSFYQVHWYTNPIVDIMKVVLDFGECLDAAGEAIGYMSELDPMWNDDDMTLIIQPEAALFANPIAQAACAVDCVAASVGFGVSELFWCAGCNGSIYPFDGVARPHISGVQASSLLTQRITAKMHRMMITQAGHGPAGMCGLYPEPLMDKDGYKYSMLYPIPQTSTAGQDHCCQPFGRSSLLWGLAKEFPVRGEDFAYFLFRKRNCCYRVVGF